MKKYVAIISALAAMLFSIGLAASAQSNVFAIEFPIAELGGCGSMQECKAYCDDLAHGEACFAFAEAHGLVKEKDVKKKEEQKKFEENRKAVLEKQGGPGGCTSEETCKAFCSDPVNGEECLAFVKENGLRSSEELDNIESKIQQGRRKEEAVRAGNGPGGCNSAEACRSFCSVPANRKTCFEFAKEHNLIPPEELARIEKEGTLPQTGPGGCTSREECDAFCRTPDNMQVCLDFAVEKGHITAEQATKFKETKTGQMMNRTRGQVHGPQVRGPEGKIDEEKARQLLETTGGPGGCTSFEECGAFCSAPENGEACFAFAKEHGLMDTADVERIEKIQNTEGPGGCRGRQCEQYCSEDGHEEECLNFAVDNGLVPQEEVAQAKKFVDIAKQGGPGGCHGRQCQDFCNRPENQEQCLAFAKEKGLLPPEELGRIEKLQNTMKTGGGPGACTSEQSCRSYCQDTSHFEECAAFAVGVGLVKPEEAMTKLQEFVGAGGGARGVGSQQGREGAFGQSDQQGFGQGQQQGFGGQGQQQGFGRPGGQGMRGQQTDDQMQQQFEERFKQFEQFKSQFEGGTRGQSSSGQGQGMQGNPLPGGPGGGATQGNFPGGQGMPLGRPGTQGQMPPRSMRPPKPDQDNSMIDTNDEGMGEGQPFDGDAFKQQFNNQMHQNGAMQQQPPGPMNGGVRGQSGIEGGMGGGGSMKPGMNQQGFGFPGQGSTQGQFPGGGKTEGNFPGGGQLPPQANPAGGPFGQPGQQGGGSTGGFPPPGGGTQDGFGQPGQGGGFRPPGGESFQPPTGGMMPPGGGGGFMDGGGGMPPGGSSGGGMPPQSGGMMPPGAFGNMTRAIAAVLSVFFQVLK